MCTVCCKCQTIRLGKQIERNTILDRVSYVAMVHEVLVVMQANAS